MRIKNENLSGVACLGTSSTNKALESTNRVFLRRVYSARETPSCIVHN